MVVADTSFLIDLLAGHAGARAALQGFIDGGKPLWIPAPALHELYYGAGLHRLPDRERKRIEDVERGMPVLPFDAAAARLAGRVEAAAERAGRVQSRSDFQIASIALLRGEAVVTGDRTFPRPEGLELVTY